VSEAAPDKPERLRRTVAEMARLRQDILAHALDVFLRKGHEAVSIRGITEHFGIAPATFYGYFPTKKALMACLWVHVFRELFDKQLRVSQASRQPLKVLEAHIEVGISHWESQPSLYRFIFMSGGDGHSAGPIDFGDDPIYEQLLCLGRERIAACAKGKVLTESQVRMIQDLLWVKMLGYLHATIALGHHTFTDKVRMRRLLIEQMLRDAVDAM